MMTMEAQRIIHTKFDIFLLKDSIYLLSFFYLELAASSTILPVSTVSNLFTNMNKY